jgi:dTDP-glucose 4,6-dehydratase
MKILVTGGLGAIGSKLCHELQGLDNQVWVCDLPHASLLNYIRCDIANYQQIKRVINTVKPDFVYHLAAEFGRRNGEDHYYQLWQSNAIGTKNMLRLQENYKFRMCFSSSSEIYGDWKHLMSEEVPEQHPIRQLNDYALSKWVNEMQIMNSAARFSTETVRVRLFNTYGPGEYYSSYRSVICQFIYRALHNIPYTVYLDHHRTSSYINDTVRTLSNICRPEMFKSGEVYNIAGTEYHDIKTISDMILNYLGKDDSKVQYEKYEEHNTGDKKGDLSKAEKDLNHRPQVNLAEGIPLTIEWQKKIYDTR